ncbi:SnoaL-like domain-containing protein [Streptomyces sp. S3(2020)]|uniref:nuclear transport factor 2 family protein n=1 Tax=Streptomyces sp. S3(2020) TaxID=2732044 RepID=UPI0014887A7C|nr:nuclear transport factor 2 family protein [Streptomyces sp. S3(2020)]NNN35111.1 SnoaL-like domain-containing protein [Streptomyces sp. S3(2020)]
MSTKNLVVEGVLELTGGTDTDAALDKYYAPAFIQHSPLCAAGPAGLRQLTERAKSAGARYDLLRSIAEGDMVLLHARVTGLAEVPLILFNLYRAGDGKVQEHWEAVGPELGPTASGHDMGDGSAEVTDLDRTEANKELVRRLLEDVFVGGDLSTLDGYTEGGELIRHASGVADGVSGLRETLAAADYLKLHRVIAEGNFVFAQSEGTLNGKPHAFGDLFRVADGKIAEYWDVRTEIPETLPHDNGMF